MRELLVEMPSTRTAECHYMIVVHDSHATWDTSIMPTLASQIDRNFASCATFYPADHMAVHLIQGRLACWMMQPMSKHPGWTLACGSKLRPTSACMHRCGAHDWTDPEAAPC